jgi:hypothetical protein
MGQKWKDRDELAMRQGASEPTAEVEARTLGWAEIAGLIEIRADGSWRPTDFGWAQLLKLERNRDRVGYVQ